MADKAYWSGSYLRQLIDVCKGEIEAGNRPMGTYTSSGWKNIISKFEEKSGQKRTRIQFKNKLDSMKKEYTIFMELKNYATGLGWNVEKQTVDCPDEWWTEHLARCNNTEKGIKCSHVKFRKQGLKYLDDLHILFDKVHVTGATASCPGDISSDDSSDDNVAEVQKTPDNDDVKLAAFKRGKKGKKKRKGSSSAIEDKEGRSPFLRAYKNTCLRIENAAQKISSSVEASSAPPANRVPSLTETMKMVKECGVEEKTALMRTATLMIKDPEFKEIFNSLETTEGRFDLLQREHDERELMKRV